MGPPSRYNLYTSAHSHPQSSQPPVPTENGVDTASLSNTELAKHFLKLFATAVSFEDFSSEAANAFSRHVNITVNGVHLSRDLYAQQWGAAFSAAGTISFGGAMETPNVRIPMFQNAALVGIMYEANFSTPVDRQGAAVRSTAQVSIPVFSTINLVIAEDKTLPSSCIDRRRIVSVNQVLVDKDGLLMFPLRNL